MLKNDSIFKMSCSFFSEGSHCGPAPGKEDITIIPVKSCANNIFDHLSALGVSGKTKDGNTQIGEAEVLFIKPWRFYRAQPKTGRRIDCVPTA